MFKSILRKFVWPNLLAIVLGIFMIGIFADMAYVFFELPKLTKDDFEIVGVIDEFYYDDYVYDSKNQEYLVFFDEASKAAITVSLVGNGTESGGGFYDVVVEAGDGSENRVEIWSATKKHWFSEYETSVAIIYTNDENIYEHIEMER